GDIPLEQRQAAREKYHDAITELESGRDLPMPPGSASVEMMSGITAATGKEVALLRSPDGQRYMKLGDEHSVDRPPGTKIIAHTHPGGNLTFSNEDIAALRDTHQGSSVLVGADGTAGRFRVPPEKEITAAQRETEIREPDRVVEVKDPERFQKFFQNADQL